MGERGRPVAGETGDAPRIYHTGSSDPDGTVMTDGGTVNLEAGFPSESVRDLQKLGHRFGVASMARSAVTRP